MSSELSIGDVLQVSCPEGLGYVAYAGTHPRLGDAIWVVPRMFASPATDWDDVFGKDGYFVFYPVHAALRRRLVKKVGFSLRAMRPVPSTVRNAVQVDDRGAVISWLITTESSRVPKSATDLSEEELQLPVADIWNHKLLCEQIARGEIPDYSRPLM